MVSMIPFGLLAGFAGEKEVRIIGLDESGFEFRVRKGTLLNEGKFTLCFWNIETAEYDEINIYDEELDVEFLVHVTLPPNYDDNKTYPVFFLTDGVGRLLI